MANRLAMRSCLVSAGLFFLVLSSFAMAQDVSGGEGVATNSRIFPPDDCVSGELNLIVWHGHGSPTRCLQVPTCVGQDNQLQFDGSNFVCTETGTPVFLCDPTEVSWRDSDGRHTCHGTVNRRGAIGQEVRVSVSDPRFEGSARFQCDSAVHHTGSGDVTLGKWKQIGAARCRQVVHPASDCAAVNIEWTVNSATCLGRVRNGKAHETVTVRQSPTEANPVMGTARFTCVSYQDCPEGLVCPAVMPYWQLNEGAACDMVAFPQ